MAVSDVNHRVSAASWLSTAVKGNGSDGWT